MSSRIDSDVYKYQDGSYGQRIVKKPPLGYIPVDRKDRFQPATNDVTLRSTFWGAASQETKRSPSPLAKEELSIDPGPAAVRAAPVPNFNGIGLYGPRG